MSGQQDPTRQVARKEHRCTWCGESIVIGEHYTRWRYFGGDTPHTGKMHDECFAVYTDDGDGEYFEFDNERPEVKT